MQQILFLFLFFVSFYHQAQAAEFYRDDNINITGSFTDNIFASGENINVQFNSEDDAYIAGGDIQGKIDTSASLFMAAGNISLDSSKALTSSIAGGSISITRSNFRELIIAGGSVQLDDSKVEDDFMAAGGTVRVGPTSEIKGSTVLAGRVINLSGKFAQDVRAYGREIHIGPEAIIGGNFSHRASQINIDPKAQILGEIIPLAITRTPGVGFSFMGLLVGLLFFITTLMVAPIVIYFFPGWTASGSNALTGNFWSTVGKGSLVVLFAPVIFSILIISIIGIPIALALLPFILAAAIIAWSIIAFAVGQKINNLINKSTETSKTVKAQMGWTFLGAFVLMLFQVIPVFGFPIHLLIMFAGLGVLINVKNITPPQAARA